MRCGSLSADISTASRAARLMLGHLGETLPFLLVAFRQSRPISRPQAQKAAVTVHPENLIVTTSGMCSAEPLNCTIAALGLKRVMFGADHPFETVQEAGEFLDHVSIRRSSTRRY